MSRLLQFSLITTFLVLSVSVIVFGPKASAEPLLNSTGAPYSTVQFAALIGSNSVNAACQGISLGTNSTCPKNSADSITTLLKTIINILSLIVGIISIIMIVVGGFKYITSGGEANKTASASKTILYAIIGLVVAVLAQLLVHFVLTKLSTAATSGSIFLAKFF